MTADSSAQFVARLRDKPVIAVYQPDGKFVKEKTMPPEKFEKWKTEHTVAK